MRRLDPMAWVMYLFARLTDWANEWPRASPAVMAAEYVQPVP